MRGLQPHSPIRLHGLVRSTGTTLPYLVLLGWSNRWSWDGRGICHLWGNERCLQNLGRKAWM